MTGSLSVGPGFTEEEALKVIRRTRANPAWWCEEVLGRKPWSVQTAILKDLIKHKRVFVKSCHAAGKSFLAAITVLWWQYSRKGAVSITTAPTFRQVKKVVWQEINRCYKSSFVPLGGECLTTELRVEDGWYAMGLSTKDPDSFQGIHSYSGRVLAVADEASGIPRDLWPAIDGITTGDDCRIFGIGNPTDPTSVFAEECASPLTKTVKISAFDTPNFTHYNITMDDIVKDTWRDKIGDDEMLPFPFLITPGWVADRYVAWGEESPLFVSRVLAEFPDQSSNTLFPLSWIENAQNNELEPDPELFHALSCDVARYGGDETTIYERRGSHCRIKFHTRASSVTETTGRVIRTLADTQAPKVGVDVVGIGAGVVDQLKEQEYPVEELNAATRPQDTERFANSRAEWFWMLREALDPSLPGEVDLDPLDDELCSQLTNIKYKINMAGKILIESKDDMKKRGLQSPDRADTLAMLYAKTAIRKPQGGSWGHKRVLH